MEPSTTEATVKNALEDYYRDGVPPWDTKITPPELVDLIEGDNALPRAELWSWAAAPEPTRFTSHDTSGTWSPSM